MRRKILNVILFILLICVSAPDGTGESSVPKVSGLNTADYSPSLSSAGTAPALRAVGQIGGPVKAIAAAKSLAYVSVGPRLVVASVSESGVLTELGASPPLPSFIEDVVVTGALVYAAAGEAGFYVLDVSTRAAPTVVGAWNSPGFARALAISGDRVYVADGPYGLRIVEVSDPSHPVETGWAYPLHYAMGVAVSGSIVGVASAVDGLLIADVTDPYAPVELGSLDTPGCSFGIEMVGQKAYVADGWEGVVTIDLSDPSCPVELDSLATPGWAFDVAVDNSLTYVTDAFEGMRVIDSSNPSSLQEVGGYAAGGDLARLVVDVVSDPANPRSAAQIDTQGYAVSVKVSGKHVFVATIHGPEGLDAFDVSDPASPIRVSFFEKLHGPYRGLDIANGIAFLADEWGLALVDISDPCSPFESGWIDLEWSTLQTATNGVGVEGTLAAVTQAFEGV